MRACLAVHACMYALVIISTTYSCLCTSQSAFQSYTQTGRPSGSTLDRAAAGSIAEHAPSLSRHLHACLPSHMHTACSMLSFKYVCLYTQTKGHDINQCMISADTLLNACMHWVTYTQLSDIRTLSSGRERSLLHSAQAAADSKQPHCYTTAHRGVHASLVAVWTRQTEQMVAVNSQDAALA